MAIRSLPGSRSSGATRNWNTILARTFFADRKIEEFENQFLAYLGSDGKAFFVPSGREAFEIVLRALCPGGSGLVIIPSFFWSRLWLPDLMAPWKSGRRGKPHIIAI